MITLGGKLSGDAVEGGGLFLLGQDGTRAELVLPRGWRTASGEGVLDAVGRRVAGMADDVLVDGSFTEAIASIRQQGRRFLVTSMRCQPTPASTPD